MTHYFTGEVETGVVENGTTCGAGDWAETCACQEEVCIIKQQDHDKTTHARIHAHDMVTEQAKQFARREYESTSVLESISFEKIINEVDTKIWNFLWELVYGSS